MNNSISDPARIWRAMTAGDIDPVTAETRLSAIATRDAQERYASQLPPRTRGGNGQDCPHYGRDVPEGWTGCSTCPVTQECYMLWEARIEAANEEEERAQAEPTNAAGGTEVNR